MSAMLSGFFIFLFGWSLLTANNEIIQTVGVIFYLTLSSMYLVAGLILMQMKVSLNDDVIKTIIKARPEHFKGLRSFRCHRLTVSFLTTFAMALTAINHDYHNLSLYLCFSYVFASANYIMYRNKFLHYCEILGIYGYGQRRF